jgi:hypothetical protein
MSSIGYSQGINFIAATLYLNLQDEEETYWMLMYILKDKDYGKVYTPDLTTFQTFCYQLEALIKKNLPRIHNHFVYCCVSVRRERM